MKPQNFVAMPKELLLIIFTHLHPRHLSVLCYNKALSATAQDMLYRHYSGDSHNILKFLRTILENSDLALRVRYVYLDRLHTSKDSILPEDCVSCFTAAISDLCVPVRIKRHWIQRTLQGHREALA